MKKTVRSWLAALFLAASLILPALAYPLEPEVTASELPPRTQELGGFSAVLRLGARASYADGVLTVTGGQTELRGGRPGERIVVKGRCALTLSGVDIEAEDGAGITLAPGAQVTLTLASRTQNTVTGGDNYAGIQVSWDAEQPASLTVTGLGRLNARGGRNSAGIGGSFDDGVFYGDITIQGGTVKAEGGSNAAGIGSAVNAMGSQKSFKMDEQSWGVITVSGGTVAAAGNGSGAGIGGGNHADSGVIRIRGGTVIAAGASGIGSGVGSAMQDRNGGKGPGSYFGKVEIQGGTVTARANENGAGIGGAMYADGIVVISGGRVNATGGSGTMSRHGGAGIGGGFEGHGQVTVSGGSVTAQGGGGAAGVGSGGGANASGDRGRGARGLGSELSGTEITVSGGSVMATGGSTGGAGLGGGVGADSVSVIVTGGTVSAEGAAASRLAAQGGAGIGSGYSGLFPGTGTPYAFQAAVRVSVTGGTVRAVGGWGAAAMGSGAENLPAERLEIGAGADITALADGTRFALDTKPGEDGLVHGERSVAGVLQGTFTNLAAGYHRTDYEGQTVFLMQTGDSDSLTLPRGYRSFARSVPAGEYTLAAGREYFAAGETETFIPDRLTGGHVFPVSDESLTDVYFLSPVATVTAELCWDDEDNADQSRGDAVLYLFQDGAARDGESRSVPAEAGDEERRVTWTDLPKFTPDGTAERDYTVLAADMEGYVWQTEGRGAEITVTGSHSPERFPLCGEVIWLGVEKEKRPESVTLSLWADGELRGRVEVRPGENGLWTWSFGPVLRTMAGREIVYTVRSEKLKGWLAVPDGWNVLVMPWP